MSLIALPQVRSVKMLRTWPPPASQRMSSTSFDSSACRLARGSGEFSEVHIIPSRFTGKPILRISKWFLSGLTRPPQLLLLTSPTPVLAAKFEASEKARREAERLKPKIL